MVTTLDTHTRRLSRLLQIVTDKPEFKPNPGLGCRNSLQRLAV
jgi:hypothetical protein